MKHGNAEEAILAQERAALDRWSAGDAQGYAESAADDVTYFDYIGAQVRVDGIQAFRDYLSGLQFPVHNYEIVNPKVQVYGDVGVLTLHYQVSSLDGDPMGTSKGTCVYRRIDGTWHSVHAHWSKVE